MMQVATQLSLFLANRPGTLMGVCEVLSKAKINIYAITTSDTIDHSVVRLVVDRPKEAMQMLEEHGALVIENEVIMVEGSNRPGSLSEIAGTLARHRINIEYAYCATLPGEVQGLLVLRPSHVAKALKALNQRAGSSKRK